MSIVVVRLLTFLLAAILAGVSLGIWVGFNPVGLSFGDYLIIQQKMVGSLRVLMVSLVFLATFFTMLSAYFERKTRTTFFMLLIAAGLFIACILITRFGNKPIDDLMLSWTADSIPNNWQELRDKWWTLHTFRTLVEGVALILVAWTGVRKNS